MALPIGHRNGVKVPARGNGLYRIRRPRGIPFYNPAEVYQKQDCMVGENVNIVFKARGRLTNGTPEIIGRLRGSTRMMFAPGADPSSTFDFDVTQSYKLKGDTTIHFYQRAKPTSHHTMLGVSWIVFNLRVLVHKLTGGSSMTFATYGQMKTYVLKGNIDFTFSAVLQSVKLIKYGFLYNWLAVTDARNICPDGWHIPTKTEFETLTTYLGGSFVAGGKLKETGLIYWSSPNTGATNEVGFNGRGSGSRSDITFGSIRVIGHVYSSTGFVIMGAQYGYVLQLWDENDDAVTSAGVQAFNGLPLRPFKDITDLQHGQTGIYIGNDGRVYRTICIGTQEVLADNLAETKYRNGDSIPEVTDAGDWAAASGGAMCAYDNDWSNVFI